MKFVEIFVFHGCIYRVEISDRQALPNAQLSQKIYKKRRKIATSAASYTVSVVLCFMTLVPGFIGCALSARAGVVAGKKLNLLEAEWAARGQAELPVRVFQDIMLPAGVATTTRLTVSALKSS